MRNLEELSHTEASIHANLKDIAVLKTYVYGYTLILRKFP